MPMYNLIEYVGNYSKISQSLWQYYSGEPFINDNRVIIDIPDDPDNPIIVAGDYGERKTKFAITDSKLHVPVVTLSAQDNEKLLQQLKICFKRIINWNKYQSDPTLQARNRY